MTSVRDFHSCAVRQGFIVDDVSVSLWCQCSV